MEKKTIRAMFFNGSPRKNKNTADMLQSAMRGAEAAGAETELVHLYDIDFKGCKSCFACKIKNSKCNGICAFMERLMFPIGTYMSATPTSSTTTPAMTSILLRGGQTEISRLSETYANSFANGRTRAIYAIMFLMLAAFSFSSCHQAKQETKAEQQADSTEVLTNADTLQLVIGGEESAVSNSAEPVRLKLPLDSVVIEMVNSTDMTCITGEWYTIEHRVNGQWETLPIKPRKDGAVYVFPDIGYELAAHTSRHFTIHILPDMYDFELGRKYRIGKEYNVSGEKRPSIAYCYFKTE